MKIEKIEWSSPLATIYWTPNWFEKLIGIKPCTARYFDNGRQYLDGCWKWFNEDGSVYGRFEEIDNYVRSLKFKKNI